tara:strand:- start:362 stop:652 length:291 start_codon:yes stop_codon:yes gene_type:complete
MTVGRTIISYIFKGDGMSKTEKLIAKLKSAKHGYVWSDLVALLTSLGFTQIEGAGSRVKFVKDGVIISLHKPHPQKEIKAYAIKQIRHMLKSEGYL